MNQMNDDPGPEAQFQSLSGQSSRFESVVSEMNLVSTLSQPALLVNETGRIRQVNKRAEGIGIQSHESGTDYEWKELFHPYTSERDVPNSIATGDPEKAMPGSMGHLQLSDGSILRCTVTTRELEETDDVLVIIDCSVSSDGQDNQGLSNTAATISRGGVVTQANSAFETHLVESDIPVEGESIFPLSNCVTVHGDQTLEELVQSEFGETGNELFFVKLADESGYAECRVCRSHVGVTIEATGTVADGLDVAPETEGKSLESMGESELRAMQLTYEALFNNPNSFTALLDQTGAIVEANENTLAVAEETEAELYGTKMWRSSLYQNQTSDIDLQTEFEQALNGNPSEVDFSIYIGGVERSFKIIGVPIYEDGEIVNVFTYGRDITDYKRARRELKQHKRDVETHNQLMSLNRCVYEEIRSETTQEGVYKKAYEAFDECPVYDSVWVAEYSPKDESLNLLHAVGGDISELSEKLLLEQIEGSSVYDAVLSGEFQVSEDSSDAFPPEIEEKWGMSHCKQFSDEYSSTVVIPIQSRGSTYGVIACCGSSLGVNINAREINQLIGRRIGKTLSDIRCDSFSASQEVTQLDIYTEGKKKVPEGFFPEDGEVEIQTIHAETSSFVNYGRSKGVSREELAAALNHYELGSSDLECTVYSDERGEISFRSVTDSSPLADIGMLEGVEFHSLEIQDTGLYLSVNIPKGAAPREALDAIQSMYPDASIESRISLQRGEQTDASVRNEIMSELTDRQRSVLEIAAREGYWDMDTSTNQTEMAEALNIHPSTFREHLKKGSQKVADEVF